MTLPSSGESVTSDDARALLVSAPEIRAVAELERVAVFAQAARGLVPEWATRPALPHEVRAGINFVELDRIQTQGYDRVAQILRDFLAAVTASAAAAVAGMSDEAAIAAALTLWADQQPAVVQAAGDDAVAAISLVLAGVYGLSAAQVVKEALYQGAVPDLAAVVAGPADAARFAGEARSPVLMVRTQVVQTVLNVSQGRARVDDVMRVLGQLGIRQAEDLGRQAVNIAHGAGRAEQAQLVGPTPQEIVASELLDGRTCPACKAIDGHVYASMPEALADYPNAGGYRDCKGGARCRGTLVIIWPSENRAPI